MTSREAAAALEEAELQRHLDRDREELADDERGPAELAEWRRITQLLATTGGVYDPESDAFVQDEREAEAAEAEDAVREQERQERLHSRGMPERAHMLMALEGAGLLGSEAEGRHGAEGPLVLHEPEDLYALDYLSEYGYFEMHLVLENRDMAPPGDLAAVPASVRAHSGLLRAMARTGTLEGFDPGHAVRLAQADPDAVHAVAAWTETCGRGSR